MDKPNNLMDKIVSLCKRRGFVFPGSETYGGLANSWDYGPLGVELKNNIKNLWWGKFVHQREDVLGLDAALIMNSRVWRASGHLENFSDALIECKSCHQRFKAEDLGYQKDDQSGNTFLKIFTDGNRNCPNCGKDIGFTSPEKFNLMFQTFIGPTDPLNNLFSLWLDFQKSEKNKDKFGKEKISEEINNLFKNIMETLVFLRPETAQAMFVDFKNVLDSSRKQLPFGVAQIGKAFRNEITPGNFIFRTREFEQMEIEYFIKESEWEKSFDYWREQMFLWAKDIGIKKMHEFEVPEGERAHYSKRTIDFEYDFPFGRKELYGLAYRGDFDLRNHFKNPPYRDPETNEEFWPHVIEPTWGVDRTILAVLLEAYDDSNKERIVLHLKSSLAPFKIAVFPLLRNKPELVEGARKVFKDLKKSFSVTWDDRGNIGKRYFSQDEIGTPYCVTFDFDSLNDKAVTVRDRDTMEQERVAISELPDYLEAKLS
ncbi:MAG: glycine--tRNA ligase [bacterium]|nr:glycine--tRNA ligase [bacterium]